MIVKELIERLQKIPSDAPIYANDNEYGPYEIEELEHESLCDLQGNKGWILSWQVRD